MKVSEQWLHEWVKPALSREEMCERMTMAGLEIESVMPVAEPFSQVVVGKILSIAKHPEADRLNICEVDIGAAKPLTIVCGAQNAAVGINVPTALEGAVLPQNLNIIASQVRGITSYGMLCSAKELSLAEQSEGLLILPSDAKIGENVWEYLKLTDHIIDVSITPNRGDCLSIKGLAKEISALTQTKITAPSIQNIKPTLSDVLSVSLHAPQACPHYVGRIIRNVKIDAVTPIWIQERLRRAGTRCINPVVDVMNYVMYELGQPMHAFDLAKIASEIQVRNARATESIALLDGQTVELTEETLIIADNEKPLAVAGVMGGLDSSVTSLTQDIFLESAYFTPQSIARTSRSFNLNSESCYRFERGVDPLLPVIAIERATQLLLDITGGKPGPVIDAIAEAHFPQSPIIHLRKTRVEAILGISIPDNEIVGIMTRLGFECVQEEEGWRVRVPSTRADISLEVDLIEEIIRLYGVDRIPLREVHSSLRMLPDRENQLTLSSIRNTFRDLGYHEIVTYSFVDAKLQEMVNPGKQPKVLKNPMTVEMSVMRTNLWPGLLKTLIYNINRQQNRVRLFETGLQFVPEKQTYSQERMLSGLVSGTVFPDQWGVTAKEIDFFDLKGDLQCLFKHTLQSEEFTFQAGNHPGLHPGQTAEIYRQGHYVGVMGRLHPRLAQTLDLPNKVYLFELSLDKILSVHIPHYTEISKFPEIKRDIAIFVDRSIPVQQIQDTITNVAGDLLKAVNLFDVYQGQNVGQDRKSLALSLTLQHSSRTLVDEEVAEVMDRVIVELKDQFAAELRG